MLIYLLNGQVVKTDDYVTHLRKDGGVVEEIAWRASTKGTKSQLVSIRLSEVVAVVQDTPRPAYLDEDAPVSA